jgi:4-hydroxybenzoate polyprenyltransferase
MSLTSVQRWVMSTLVAITILHLSAGVVVAAYFSTKQSSQIGLLVISAAFGVIAIVAALLIHKRRPISPWLLLGLLPALAGSYWIFV